MNDKSSTGRAAHWAKTKRLTVITLIIWAIFSFGIHFFADHLNTDTFPGSYFWSGFGSQVAFAILIFWFATRQDKIDADHGVSE